MANTVQTFGRHFTSPVQFMPSNRTASIQSPKDNFTYTNPQPANIYFSGNPTDDDADSKIQALLSAAYDPRRYQFLDNLFLQFIDADATDNPMGALFRQTITQPEPGVLIEQSIDSAKKIVEESLYPQIGEQLLASFERDGLPREAVEIEKVKEAMAAKLVALTIVAQGVYPDAVLGTSATFAFRAAKVYQGLLDHLRRQDASEFEQKILSCVEFMLSAS